MKAFVLKDGPFLKSKQKVSHIELTWLYSLGILFLFAWTKNGIHPFLNHNMSLKEMLLPFFLLGITFIISTITFFTTKKIKHDRIYLFEIIHLIVSSLILVLLLPIQVPIYVLIFGSVIMAILECFDKIKKYMNPIVISILIVIMATSILTSTPNIYYNAYEQKNLEAISMPSLIDHNHLVGYQQLVQPYGKIKNFAIGNVPGALGATSIILLSIIFLYLVYKKNIKWEITLTYLFTIFIMSSFIGNLSHFGYWYPIYQILSGGVMFVAIVLATNNISTPVTPIGKILYGLGLGILTILFRYFTPCYEAALLSVLLMSFLNSILDRIGSIARFHFEKSIPFFLSLWVLMIGISVFIGTKY